jgi:tetraacyldisaccharide 4'-kinase
VTAARPWLLPLGALYGLGARARVQAYRGGLLRPTRLRGSVISVGNLSVGGSGKTPVVALIAETLQRAGRRVAVLSRGYGGTFQGAALIVSDGAAVHADAELAGDEPVMLARGLPGAIVAVGRNRDQVGRAVEERFGPVVHVLDDGFQHLRLARDLDVLCVHPDDLRDAPLPAGRLREFASSAARADVVLVAEEGGARGAWPANDGRVFTLRRRVLGCVALDGSPREAPRQAYLVSGIARPERFAADVAALGVNVVGHRAFADHHRFATDELDRLCAEARARGADAVLTTAKDAVRLPPRAWEPPALVLRVAAEVVDAARFRERLFSAAARAA